MGERQSASKDSPTVKWYKQGGWEVFNSILVHLDTKNVQFAYIENFTKVAEALNNLPRKELVDAFNEDSVAWKLSLDSDGALIATKVK